MLDKESEIYNSGMLNRDAQKEHLALVVTREGIEVSAATKGLRFEYSDTWEHIRGNWAEADRRLKIRREEQLKLRPGFVQHIPEHDRSEPLGGN